MKDSKINKLIYFILSIINLFLIYCIIKALWIDEDSDTNGIFVLIIIAVMFFYNLYTIFLFYIFRMGIFKSGNKIIEVIKVLLVVFPIFIFLYIFY